MEIREQVEKILKIMGTKPGVFHIEILHDDGCPRIAHTPDD
jgi:hypothetical protein